MTDGTLEGDFDGTGEGLEDGALDGTFEGDFDGTGEGLEEGA